MKNQFKGVLKQLSDDETKCQVFLIGSDHGLVGVVNYNSGADFIRILNPTNNFMGYIPIENIKVIVPED